MAKYRKNYYQKEIGITGSVECYDVRYKNRYVNGSCCLMTFLNGNGSIFISGLRLSGGTYREDETIVWLQTKNCNAKRPEKRI